MPDDADNDAPALEAPDPDRIYRNCLETCRRLGVEPVPRERADDPIDRLSAMFAGAAPTLH